MIATINMRESKKICVVSVSGTEKSMNSPDNENYCVERRVLTEGFIRRQTSSSVSITSERRFHENHLVERPWRVGNVRVRVRLEKFFLISHAIMKQQTKS